LNNLEITVHLKQTQQIPVSFLVSKPLKSIVFIIVALIISNNAFSQSDFRDGYIVKQKHDSIFGLIDYRSDASNSKRCRFKLDPDSDIIEYSPEDLSAYRYADSKLYISRDVEIDNDTSSHFLECLISGQLNVYYLALNDGAEYYFLETDSTFFIAEDNDVYFTNEYGDKKVSYPHRYKGVFKYHIREFNDLYDEADNLKYEKESIIELAKMYHERACNGEECIIYERKIHKQNIKFGLIGFVGGSSIKYGKSYTNFEGNMDSYWGVGANLLLQQPKFNERSYADVKLAYEKMKIYATKETSVYTKELYFDITGLKLNIGYTYIYPVYSIRPVFSLGIFGEYLKFSNYTYKIYDAESIFNDKIDHYVDYGFYVQCGLFLKDRVQLSLIYEVNVKQADMEYFFRSGFEGLFSFYF